MHCFTRQQPWKGVESDSEPFVMPGLPHRIEFTKLQLPPFWKGEGITEEWLEMRDLINRSEETSFGAVVNSFHELEPGYSEHYREVVGTKAWFIGPLSLSNKGSTLEKAERGKTAAIDGHECLRWLDCREPNSVLYICFGSMSDIPDAQLLEIAAALEASGLVTDVLRVGVGIGCEEWSREDRKMVVGEDAEEMRERAMELKVKAVKANEEGGSSYSDLKSLLEELVSVRDNKDVDLSSCKL
ncbi:Scopoletin glucosyltransferase [Linum grandiflorum]